MDYKVYRDTPKRGETDGKWCFYTVNEIGHMGSGCPAGAGFETEMDAERAAKTAVFHARMKSLDDDGKMRFAINWRIPHSLFNVASAMFPGEDLQNIDWFKIYQSRDLGTWSHGGAVYML